MLSFQHPAGFLLTLKLGVPIVVFFMLIMTPRWLPSLVDEAISSSNSSSALALMASWFRSLRSFGVCLSASYIKLWRVSAWGWWILKASDAILVLIPNVKGVDNIHLFRPLTTSPNSLPRRLLLEYLRLLISSLARLSVRSLKGELFLTVSFELHENWSMTSTPCTRGGDPQAWFQKSLWLCSLVFPSWYSLH